MICQNHHICITLIKILQKIVATAIKNLSDNGYIDIAHRYNGNGQLSNLYTVLKF